MNLSALHAFFKKKKQSTPTLKETYPVHFLNAILVVLEHEGGYVNDPTDPGGETKYGISKRSYPQVDIASLTREQAIKIYYDDWWVKHKFDQYPHPRLASKVFDTAINMGAKPANKLLQRSLKANGELSIIDDGIVGNKTKDAMARCEEKSLLAAFRSEQASYYRVLMTKKPKLKKYKNGWLKRAYS